MYLYFAAQNSIVTPLPTTFFRSKSTIETLEKGVKYDQS